jgi:hypothetical protein
MNIDCNTLGCRLGLLKKVVEKPFFFLSIFFSIFFHFFPTPITHNCQQHIRHAHTHATPHTFFLSLSLKQIDKQQRLLPTILPKLSYRASKFFYFVVFGSDLLIVSSLHTVQLLLQYLLIRITDLFLIQYTCTYTCIYTYIIMIEVNSNYQM